MQSVITCFIEIRIDSSNGKVNCKISKNLKKILYLRRLLTLKIHFSTTLKRIDFSPNCYRGRIQTQCLEIDNASLLIEYPPVSSVEKFHRYYPNMKTLQMLMEASKNGFNLRRLLKGLNSFKYYHFSWFEGKIHQLQALPLFRKFACTPFIPSKNVIP